METAVEFLANVWAVQGKLYTEDVEQAKEMFEAQMKNAYNQGHNDYESKCYSPEQYYNETFKQQEDV